jgi:hypothetical protein
MQRLAGRPKAEGKKRVWPLANVQRFLSSQEDSGINFIIFSQDDPLIRTLVIGLLRACGGLKTNGEHVRTRSPRRCHAWGTAQYRQQAKQQSFGLLQFLAGLKLAIEYNTRCPCVAGRKHWAGSFVWNAPPRSSAKKPHGRREKI